MLNVLVRYQSGKTKIHRVREDKLGTFEVFVKGLGHTIVYVSKYPINEAIKDGSNDL